MERIANVNDIRQLGARMTGILGLSGSPVGIRLLSAGAEVSEEVFRLQQHRYCQALMEARRGSEVLLSEEGISCPAAAAAFGFRPLPKGLESGQGLVGFGIVSDEAVGRKMFADMPSLAPGTIEALRLFPLDKAVCPPDIVVVEDEVEKLMWVVLAYLHATDGKRVPASTAVLQATCVDSTIIPYLEGRLNFSFGCYGCRDATDIGNNESVLGFPASMLPAIMEHLEYLDQKAIPSSRSKRAWHMLRKEKNNVRS